MLRVTPGCVGDMRTDRRDIQTCTYQKTQFCILRIFVQCSVNWCKIHGINFARKRYTVTVSLSPSWFCALNSCFVSSTYRELSKFRCAVVWHFLIKTSLKFCSESLGLHREYAQRAHVPTVLPGHKLSRSRHTSSRNNELLLSRKLQ